MLLAVKEIQELTTNTNAANAELARLEANSVAVERKAQANTKTLQVAQQQVTTLGANAKAVQASATQIMAKMKNVVIQIHELGPAVTKSASRMKKITAAVAATDKRIEAGVSDEVQKVVKSLLARQSQELTNMRATIQQ